MITVVGSSNTDFTIKVNRFPSIGETVFGRAVFSSGGGKGANQAAAIAKLGGEVNFIANIGQDYFGDERIRDLKRFGVNTKFVKRDKARNSGTAFILVDKSGRNIITISPGSNGSLKLADILKRADCIKGSELVLAQLEIPLEAVRGAIYLAKRLGKTTILNPAPARRLSRDILSKVDILIPNEKELSMLTGGKASACASACVGERMASADDRHNLKYIARRSRLLLKAGVGCVIITLGKRGALLVNRKGSRLFKARSARVVDTTCAGDAFCGALAFGLDRGNPIEGSIEFANCVAAVTCSKLGAQCSLPTLHKVNISFKEG